MSIRRSETLLLVDIGNSRIKWGLGRNGRLDAGTPFSSDVEALTDEMGRLWGDLSAPTAVVVSNVAGPSRGGRMRDWVWRHWGLQVHFVQPEARGYGVVNAYENPAKLGVDRWICLVALRELHPLPACIADFGTAITVDVMDAAGRHLGGLIAPGLTLMRQALTQRTAGLQEAGGIYQGLLARNTAAALLSGVRQASVGLLERVVREASRQLGCELRVVLTGGDAETVAAELAMPHVLAPNLVLQGLLIMAENIR